ncbi:MAG: transposase [Lachnospiraceae bacterium]|nr:transposase [Lachnospiraceae bacterium]
MGNKDLAEKILMDYNDVFADILNAYLFNGEEFINPDNLENASVHSQYKAAGDELHEQERDVLKYYNHDKVRVHLGIFGIENQSSIDTKMPLRIIGYDGVNYRMQYEEEQPVPIISIVLYFGTKKKWDTHLKLSDCVDVIPEFQPYFNDYKIHVINVAWEEEKNKLLKGDFAVVADFFENMRKNPDYVPDNPQKFKHVDAVLKLLSVFSSDERYVHIPKEEGGMSMCEVADRLEKIGIAKGIEQGIEQGAKQATLRDIVNMLKYGIPEEKLLEDYTEEEIAKAKELRENGGA